MTDWWIRANLWMMQIEHALCRYMLQINRDAYHFERRIEELDVKMLKFEIEWGL